MPMNKKKDTSKTRQPEPLSKSNYDKSARGLASGAQSPHNESSNIGGTGLSQSQKQIDSSRVDSSLS